MANEITVSLTASCVNGNFTSRFQPGTVTITQAAQGAHAPIVIVGTSEEDLTTGDLATPGLFAFRNLDTTNYVTYGPKSAGNMILFGKIPAGEVALIRLGASVTLRWLANTGSVKVQVWGLES